MVETWKEDQTERKAKISAKNITLSESLTAEEKKQRYGWMNKLSADEKTKFIEEILTKTGAHAFWQNASDECKQDIYARRQATLKATWEEHGDEIHAKISAARAKSFEEFDGSTPLTEYETYIVSAIHDTIMRL